MKLFEELETRIVALLIKLDEMQAENAELQRGHVDALTALKQENALLQQQLQQEQEKVTQALGRIDSIIQLIKEKTE